MMFDPRKVMGHYDSRYPALDPTTSFYEFLSYKECCESLNVQGQPNITRYIRYRNYLKEIGLI